jgi:sugar fermentation stimulation protein A
MRFLKPLTRGRLVRRYKRFLADVELEGGELVTASCPNTGSMLGLSAPGTYIWLSTNDSPKRKYRHTWELVENDLGAGPVLVGINTGHPNRLVADAIMEGRLAPFEGYEQLKREQAYGKASRIDLLLEDPVRGRCYVEIKNVHLMRQNGIAEFPDSVTARGLRHLEELGDMAEAGHRAVMMYLIQRGDASHLRMAADIDPAYASGLKRAMARGVEAIAYTCDITCEEIQVARPVPLMF